ncbi:MAG: histidine--tRNA ligase [Planctomycetota bacterium]
MPKIQPPKGTRDFFPADMAWQQHLIDAWRRVSVRHGFEQVDGPIFEKLDLYKVKSGEGIVSELFSFRRDRGTTDFAIRPEFTPTLARMVAERANSLPKPIKWFCTPNLCRAERPQRGRLREFLQWNADVLGLDSPLADAECIALAIDLLAELGLTPDQIRVKISHRDTARAILIKLGVADDRVLDAFDLLDRRAKLDDQTFTDEAAKLGLDTNQVTRLDQICRMKFSAGGGLNALRSTLGSDADLSELEALDETLTDFGLTDWCEYDLGIVRGLAYYTGTVFEVHEATGVERALAGGGRYDKLIELFGGPPTPAVGFGMGDVVLTNVLHDKGLIPDHVMPRPDVFVLASADDADRRATRLTARLRRDGLHARRSYKTTRNVGKLLKDAAACRARFALIVAAERLELKDLDTGEQAEADEASLAERLGAT